MRRKGIMAFDLARHVFRSPVFRSVVNEAIEFFEQTPVHRLPLADHFAGSGVYALYYSGKYELYTKIAKSNRRACVQPIYVGKAVPPGWRTGRAIGSVSPDLFRRLSEHSRSTQQAANLRLDEFQCRFMILGDVESDLVVPVEAELIRRYRPLWNTVLDGFGNHDPGAGRYNQARSEWDVLHPGRSWSERLTGQSAHLEDVIVKVRESLK